MKKTTSNTGVNSELEQLLQSVGGARARLAELEVELAREKSRVEAAQAVLFRHLLEHNQKRDRLRLAVHYRQKFLDSFVRNDTDEVEQAERDLAQAKARLDEDYETMAAATEKSKPLTAEQEAELKQFWEKLVTLHQPDRFANEPDKRNTFHKLAAAIRQARDTGDVETLGKIAEDPLAFLLCQGGIKLDFSDPDEPVELMRLHETLLVELLPRSQGECFFFEVRNVPDSLPLRSPYRIARLPRSLTPRTKT